MLFVAVVVEFNDFGRAHLSSRHLSECVFAVGSVSSIHWIENCSQSFGSHSIRNDQYSFCCCWLVWDFKMWTEHDECFGCDLWRNSWTEIENAILLTLISNYIKVIMGRRVWRRYSNDVSQTLSRITTDTKNKTIQIGNMKHLFLDSGLNLTNDDSINGFFLFISFFLMRSFISETNENLVGRATHLFLNENHNNNADDFH